MRRLEALETLGSVQVFCFDKTGTITRNRISVIEVFVGEKTIKISNRQFSSNGCAIDPHTHRDLGELIRAGVLCNEAVFDKGAADGASSLSGSPTENALFHLGILAGMDVLRLKEEHPVLNVPYRAEECLFMSTLHGTVDGRLHLVLKGSPADVLALCNCQFKGGTVTPPLTPADWVEIETQNASMS